MVMQALCSKARVVVRRAPSSSCVPLLEAAGQLYYIYKSMSDNIVVWERYVIIICLDRIVIFNMDSSEIYYLSYDPFGSYYWIEWIGNILESLYWMI